MSTIGYYGIDFLPANEKTGDLNLSSSSSTNGTFLLVLEMILKLYNEGGTSIENWLFSKKDPTNMFLDGAPWDSFESNMAEVSRSFPNIVVRCDFERYDDGDRTRYYFWNGRMAWCVPIETYPDYNPADLEEVTSA